MIDITMNKLTAHKGHINNDSWGEKNKRRHVMCAGKVCSQQIYNVWRVIMHIFKIYFMSGVLIDSVFGYTVSRMTLTILSVSVVCVWVGAF